MTVNLFKRLALASLVFSITTTSSAVDLAGEVIFEARAFSSPQYSDQLDNSLSVALAPEFNWDFDNGSTLTFSPFYRYDSEDPARRHGDIRELYWQTTRGNWEINIGLRKEFWGVIESVHLVDVINQTDTLEGPDGEEKFGQPMISLTSDQDWGALTFYLMPYFRERLFGEVESRFRTPFIIDDDKATFESSAQETHTDIALRYSTYIGSWDIGLNYFRGTNREPLLISNQRLINGESVVEFIPHYEQMSQISTDLQYTVGSWLFKLEALHRDTKTDDFFAVAGGFEYTFYGIGGSAWDIGALVEYVKDQRNSTTVFQNDLFSGVRITANDVAGTEFLAGFFYDLDNDSVALSVETSRRLSDHWTISAEVRAFSNVDDSDPFAVFKDDNMLQIDMSYHF